MASQSGVSLIDQSHSEPIDPGAEKGEPLLPPSMDLATLRPILLTAFSEMLGNHGTEVLATVQPLIAILDERLTVEEKQLFRTSYWQLASMVLSYCPHGHNNGSANQLLFETFPNLFQ